MRSIARGTAETYGLAAEVSYTREFVPLRNDPALTRHALAAAEAVFGAENVAVAEEPMTASEDFAQFLRHVPGNFAFIGNGEDSAPLHNPRFDFNDAALLEGARFHAEIARRRLAGSSAR